MWNCVYIYILLFSFLVSLLLIPFVKKLAVGAGVVDKPGKRKIHRISKPLLGGIAIYASFIITILVNIGIVYLIAGKSSMSSILPAGITDYFRGVHIVQGKLRIILAGGTLMMLLGLLDDIYDIRFRIKLAVQVVAALLLVWANIRITLFIPNIYLSGFLTVLWVVGITNAFNLLDNMDGLSAGVAVIASVLFFAAAFQQNQIFVSVILIAFTGSLLGFLKHNFNPASIFMGDAGSLFIGYTLASLSMLNTYYSEQSPTLLPVIIPVLILAVPIFDTISVIWIRYRHRESIFKADKRHFSHRLVSLGMTQRQAVLLVYLVTFCVGVSAILLRYLQMWGVVVILIQAVGIFGIIISLEFTARKKQKTV